MYFDYARVRQGIDLLTPTYPVGRELVRVAVGNATEYIWLHNCASDTWDHRLWT
jgi:hypothetical protein